ncbi:MAG TPA: alpha/beta hydrolase [Streptosporangiaceae bacterium]
MPTVTVDDLSMYYEWHGADDAEPMVVICGLGNDISQFQPLIDGLARRYRVLAFDNRGAGRTDKPDEPYTIEQMAADTAGLMHAAGLPHAAVLGISMGGRVALALALAEPAMVDRLILASTGARVVGSWRRALTIRLAAFASARGPHPQPGYAFRRQAAASQGFDATPRLGEIRAPALILHAVDDRVAPLAIAEEMHAGLSGSVMRTFRGGHAFMLMKGREEFLDAVSADDS